MKFDVNVNVNVNLYLPELTDAQGWMNSVSETLGIISDKLSFVNRTERTILMNLKDIQTQADATLAQVQADTSVANGVKAVVDQSNVSLAALKQQIADLQAAGTVDPADLQKLSDTITAIQSTDLANSATVSAAVVAGTPAA